MGFMEQMSTILTALRGRRSRGLVAARTGVPASTLADLERGNVQLKVLENLVRLADYYGVSLEYLVRGNRNQHKTTETEWSETTAQLLLTMRDVERTMQDGLGRIGALMDELERQRAENLSAAHEFVDALAQIIGEDLIEEYLDAMLAVARGEVDALSRLNALITMGESREDTAQQL